MTKFLQGPKQFLIPIYQRKYSWTEKQCEQLWNDVTSIATADASSHFIGSIVYIVEGPHQADVSQLLVIDGQQRLSTLTLLFAALARAMDVEKIDSSETKPKKIRNYFLLNSDEEREKRYKLILTRSDNDTLHAIIEDRPIPKQHSKNLVNNFEYFQDKIAESDLDLDTIYRGMGKLMVVYISLDAGNDNPQLIFESLNSTGLDLSQADLIRNYILMGLERDEQEAIYTHFWHPMEEGFEEKPQEFDYFIRDYLTIKTGQIPKIKNVYSSFKEYDPEQPIEKLVSDIHYFAKFYTRLAFGNEHDAELKQKIHDINALKSDVTYPFLLEVYVDYDKNLISRNEILEIFGMVESYVFRRAICDIPTNTLGRTFAGLAKQVEKSQYVESLKAALCLMGSYKRFPTDVEFADHFVRKDVYNTTHIRKHLLDRLENHDRKERVNVDDYTVEHIMPQNENLSQEWKDELGSDWKKIHEKYLHTVGNLTLTRYNQELGDKPFLKKRNTKGGFADSPIRLSADLRNLECWGEYEICNRGSSLFNKAKVVWKYPYLSQGILEKYSKMDEDDDLEDDDPEYDEAQTPQWKSQLVHASEQVQHNIGTLVSQIHQRFDCVEEPHSKWLIFYVKKPTENKAMFALLMCGKNTANVAFRIDPVTFKTSKSVRKVAGWFFPAGTERRISLTEDSVHEIVSNLGHSYDATMSLIKKRRGL